VDSAPVHLPQSKVQDCYVVQRKVHWDDRGSFCELLRVYPDEAYNPVQQNQSFSFGGVLRGMHTQKKDPQGKLVTCLYGTVLDVIFDVRPESPTFNQGLAVQLDMRQVNSIWVPPGCLHGFLTLSEFAVVHYSCSSYYDPSSDGGVRWDSPGIKELFPEGFYPQLSAKDRALPTLSEFLETT
jgi:dTDP-4-dehydrorhamnose 3,5-epimerase